MDEATRNALGQLARELLALKAAHNKLAEKVLEQEKVLALRATAPDAAPTGTLADHLFYGEDDDS